MYVCLLVSLYVCLYEGVYVCMCNRNSVSLAKTRLFRIPVSVFVT